MELKTKQKTYKAESAFLPLGLVEDILKAVNINDLLGGVKTQEQQAQLGLKIVELVVENFDSFKGLLIQTFDGLTEEELRTVDIADVAKAVYEIVIFSITKLFSITAKK